MNRSFPELQVAETFRIPWCRTDRVPHVYQVGIERVLQSMEKPKRYYPSRPSSNDQTDFVV